MGGLTWIARTSSCVWFLAASLHASAHATSPSNELAKPDEDQIELTWSSPSNGMLSVLDLPKFAEVRPGDYKPIRISYTVRFRGAVTRILVSIHAAPGATLQEIRDTLLANETDTAHSDVLLFQGGKNNALFGGGNAVDVYRSTIQSVADHAQLIGAPLHVQEVTPIVPEMLDARGFNGQSYQNNILAFNATLGQLAEDRGLSVIQIYDQFKLNFHDGDDAWCRNPANSGILDGSHLSAAGTEQLGARWVDALTDAILSNPNPPLTVGIYGDSISAATYLPDAQKPASWLVFFDSQLYPVTLSEFRVG